MNEKILKQSIDRLDIPCQTIELLKENKIVNISQICNKTKTELKDLGILNKEIKQIEVQLQLEGLNLNSNY